MSTRKSVYSSYYPFQTVARRLYQFFVTSNARATFLIGPMSASWAGPDVLLFFYSFYAKIQLIIFIRLRYFYFYFRIQFRLLRNTSIQLCALHAYVSSSLSNLFDENDLAWKRLLLYAFSPSACFLRARSSSRPNYLPCDDVKRLALKYAIYNGKLGGVRVQRVVLRKRAVDPAPGHVRFLTPLRTRGRDSAADRLPYDIRIFRGYGKTDDVGFRSRAYAVLVDKKKKKVSPDRIP